MGKSGEGKTLRGQVFAARLYDRALTAEEIMVSSSGGTYVSEEMLLEALSEDQRDELTRLREQLRSQQNRLDEVPKHHEPHEAWARLAHAIFNLKEFIYLK